MVASSGTKENPLSPEVLWAQRTNQIFLTINLSDVTEHNVDIEKQSVTVFAHGGTEKKWYKVELKLFDEVDVENSLYTVTARQIFVNLTKLQKDQPYWPRLLESSTKPHYLRTDFSRWKDEDEQDEEGDEDIMKQFQGSGMNMFQGKGGGLGGLDMSALANLGGGDMKMGMGEPDSDDEEEEVEGQAQG
ncbi:HSP20-like chaperone [Paraphysoderma sedebokerense]|nr:HSP20-like chaperone [Paraphysoderma sedebokerense]